MILSPIVLIVIALLIAIYNIHKYDAAHFNHVVLLSLVVFVAVIMATIQPPPETTTKEGLSGAPLNVVCDVAGSSGTYNCTSQGASEIAIPPVNRASVVTKTDTFDPAQATIDEYNVEFKNAGCTGVLTNDVIDKNNWRGQDARSVRDSFTEMYRATQKCNLNTKAENQLCMPDRCTKSYPIDPPTATMFEFEKIWKSVGCTGRLNMPEIGEPNSNTPMRKKTLADIKADWAAIYSNAVGCNKNTRFMNEMCLPGRCNEDYYKTY